jgi:hypothetical protein
MSLATSTTWTFERREDGLVQLSSDNVGSTEVQTVGIAQDRKASVRLSIEQIRVEFGQRIASRCRTGQGEVPLFASAVVVKILAVVLLQMKLGSYC